MSEIEEALAEVAKAFGATGMHVNYGESEDYMRGYNDGYDDVVDGDNLPEPDPDRTPAREPWRSAYLRGYREGRGLAIRDMYGDGDEDER